MKREVCPFCGSRNIDSRSLPEQVLSMLGESRPGVVGQLFCECQDCKARGPVTDVTIDDGQNRFQESVNRWNTRLERFPVVRERDGKFLGYMKSYSIPRPPEYDGEEFLIAPSVDLLAPVNESMNESVQVIRARWKIGRVMKDGREYQGFLIELAEGDELIWKADYGFLSWVEAHGSPVR